MNKIICALLVIFMSSCSSINYIQVFETNTSNTKNIDSCYTYEDDTVKITYSFWTNKGIMNFEIYNKLNIPFYVDWKNSSLIINDIKLNYWEDVTNSNTMSNYSTYYYKGQTLVTTNGVSLSRTSKPERITFIPPKSKYGCSNYYLFPFKYFEMKKYESKKMKYSTIYYQNFNIQNSPLRFRNYVSLTFSEESKKFKIIDNEFFVSSIKEMTNIHFQGKMNQSTNKFEFPYTSPRSFYLKIPRKNSWHYILDQNDSYWPQ